MDFLNRNTNQPQGNRAAASASSAPSVVPVTNSNNNDNRKSDRSKDGFVHQPRWMRLVFMVMLISVTIVAVGALWLLHVGGTREVHFVDGSKYQAVFLTNGQVYFGKVKDITSKYVDLENIYYLNTPASSSTDKSSTSSSTDFQLIKLGCELHGPADQMIINRDQVTFWENLKSDGQVAKGIAQWLQQNPNGQTCKTTSGSTSQSTTSNATSQQSTSNSKQ